MKNRLLVVLNALAIVLTIPFAWPMDTEGEQIRNLSKKTMNVGIGPLGLIAGPISLAFDFGISEQLTLGPRLSYTITSLGATSISEVAVGATSVYFLEGPRFNDSWFISPFAQYTSATGSANTSIAGFIFGASAGYWWFWQNSFNLGWGLGLQYTAADRSSLAGTSSAPLMPIAFLQVGYLL